MEMKILLILMCVVFSFEEDCNFTHYEFFSQYSLGKQDELNKTFDQIQETLTIPSIHYKFSETLSYNLTDIKANLKYLDSQQKAQIVGKDTILIYGGHLQVEIEFKWTRITLTVNTNGTGKAQIITDQIMFEKLLVLEKGYLDYSLTHAYPISLKMSIFDLSRIDPPNPDDLDNLKTILNDGGSSSLKQVLEKQLNANYTNILKDNLKNEHYPLNDHFTYTWNDSSIHKQISINYTLIPTGVDLETAGLSMNFVSKISDDQFWQCGKSIPSQQLSPQIYGGIQEFISFSIISNTVFYSYKKGFLDTNLTRNAWQSKFFQFFAGDLYQVIPMVAQAFYALQQVTGNCAFNPFHEVQVKKISSTAFSVLTDHNCSLFIDGERVALFSLLLTSDVQITAKSTHLNFNIANINSKVDFKNLRQYKVQDKDLALLMIEASLNRLKEGEVLGSGWKIYPRDYPNIIVFDDFIVIYDSSHIESNLRIDE